MNCKICSENTSVHDRAQILNKYMITYYHCPHCGFIQTEEPYWLNEAYSKAICKSDTGIMMRNLQETTNLLFFMKFIPQGGAYLDFGGGHGILTRIMRDYGFDFYHYDKHAENLFAAGFEGDLTKNYRLVTSIENFEHFVKPLEEIEKLIDISEVLYFTTSLLPSTPPPLVKDWWYYAPLEGQHISFYTKKTLKYIAQKYNMFLLTNNSDHHILSKKRIYSQYFKFLRYYNKLNKISISRFLKRKSKTFDDMKSIISMLAKIIESR